MKKNQSIFFALGLAVLVFGCSAAGPLFKPISSDENRGKAIVYFYRNSQPGSARTYDLTVNGMNKLPVENKGYYAFIFNPGTYDFSISSHDKFYKNKEFTFQSGMTYYIQFTLEVIGYSPGLITSGPQLAPFIESVPEAAALKVLNKCHLIVPE